MTFTLEYHSAADWISQVLRFAAGVLFRFPGTLSHLCG
jgi:hypothetical protein